MAQNEAPTKQNNVVENMPPKLPNRNDGDSKFLTNSVYYDKQKQGHNAYKDSIDHG